MARLPKPARRVAARPVRLLGWLLGIRPTPGRAPTQERSIEVWQWSGSKYRWRAIILLLVNALVFVALGAFTFWLRTGRWVAVPFDKYWEDWWRAFDPTRPEQLTLIDYLLYPIPADQVPWMMVIMGLVLAALTAVPILVAMLYRFPYSLIFTAIIGFVAVLPWLAITTTLCCLLVRLRVLRFSFHYATALVAMLPLLAYYAFATRNATTAMTLPPADLARLYVPWVLAIVAACLLIAVVLLLAWMVNYRPGAIAPLLAVMFVVPIVLFEVKVGRDELYYRLLEAEFGPTSKTHFVAGLDAAAAIRQLARMRVEDPEGSPVALRAAEEQVALEWQLRLTTEVADQRQEVVSACDVFLSHFPGSRYVANALYIRGRAIDMRVDYGLFRRDWRLGFYKDFPAEASRSVWQDLHERFVRSGFWGYAALRLAMLDARTGQMNSAVTLLEGVSARAAEVEGPNATQESPKSWRTLFGTRPVPGSLDVDPAAVAIEAAKLHHLIVNNRDPQQDDRALRRLLSFDPRHPMYRTNLRQLRAEINQKYPLTALRDNLDVLIAATDPSDSRRIEALKACVEELKGDPHSDALPRARYELGMAYREDNRSAEAVTVFEEVVRLHSDSPWAIEAGRRLANMVVPP